MYLITLDRLNAVKRIVEAGDKSLNNLVQSLQNVAVKQLTTPLQSVIYKKYVPPGGDKHDYASLAKYYWPNPHSPDGLPYLQRDGEVNPQTEQYDVGSLDIMTKAVRDLSFAYFYTKDERFAQYAAKLLETWFIDSKTRMNPNLNYGQFKPGIDKIDGHGIIETHRFRWLPDSTEILKSSQHWTESHHKKLKQWFTDYLNWLLTSQHGRLLSQKPDNKGTWYATQVVLYALFTGNRKIAKAYSEKGKERIANAISPDGSMLPELKRSRSLHYHMYHLQALFDLAILARHLNVDLFSYTTSDGQSIKTAVEFLIPFTTNQKNWPYQQIDKVRYGIMEEILRRASIYYQDDRYEQLIGELPKAELGDATLISYLDLIEPPRSVK